MEAWQPLAACGKPALLGDSAAPGGRSPAAAGSIQIFRVEGTTDTGKGRLVAALSSKPALPAPVSVYPVRVTQAVAVVAWGVLSEGPGKGSGWVGMEPGHLVQARPWGPAVQPSCPGRAQARLLQSLSGPAARRTAPPVPLARPPPRRLQYSHPGHARVPVHTGVTVRGVNALAQGVWSALGASV